MTVVGFTEVVAVAAEGAAAKAKCPAAFGRKVVWSHPAFANQCAFIRNDKELVCVNLAAKK